jgi:uncharacterized membrane protein
MSNSASALPRFTAIDALRGAACVWMAAYHFCFDLRVFGWQPGWNFYSDPFWTNQRTAILSSFLLCAGIGQGIASAQGQSWARFWRRWGQVAAGALLVSVATYWAFATRFVHFGTLHGMAVMLLLVRLLAPRLPVWALGGLAALCWGGHVAYQHLLHLGYSLPAVFDARWLNWLGLVSHKPPTEDYVPLLPWLSVMLLGAALGRSLLQMAPQRGWRLAAPRGLMPLAILGRYSLSFYLLHQPLLWGLLYAAAWLGLKP